MQHTPSWKPDKSKLAPPQEIQVSGSKSDLVNLILSVKFKGSTVCVYRRILSRTGGAPQPECDVARDSHNLHGNHITSFQTTIWYSWDAVIFGFSEFVCYGLHENTKLWYFSNGWKQVSSLQRCKSVVNNSFFDYFAFACTIIVCEADL